MWERLENRFFVKAFLLICLICVISRKVRSEHLQLIYNKKNKVMNRFCGESKIGQLKFTPFTFGVHDSLQIILFTIIDFVHLNTHAPKCEREIVVSKESRTTVGLDWLCDAGKDKAKPSEIDKCSRPIVVILPGLGGSPNHYY